MIYLQGLYLRLKLLFGIILPYLGKYSNGTCFL